MKIQLMQDGILIRNWFTTQKKTWETVVSITAYQVDMLTYFESFIQFKFSDNTSVQVSELNDGLAQLEDTLLYFGVENNWYSQLESSGPGTNIVLYQNDEAAK